jgi:hypothetical protein
VEKSRLGCLTRSGLIIAVLAILVLSAVLILWGGVLFTPGPLNAQSGKPLGGVSSHAAIGSRCSTCHAPFWDAAGMASLCMKCHTDIAAQQFNSQTLHGSLLAGGMSGSCWTCHPDHRGANAALTFIDPAHFSHANLGYPTPFLLTGAHVGVACTRCHANNIFNNTPRDCASCHPEPASHVGQFSTDCVQCHSTSNWNSNFVHPDSCGRVNCLDHHRATCADCHPVNYSTATCTKCHRNNNPGGEGGGG